MILTGGALSDDDSIIGLSDGLTVPFALTAGLSSLGKSKLVYMGGLAEIVRPLALRFILSTYP
jgi:hypothetical protein